MVTNETSPVQIDRRRLRADGVGLLRAAAMAVFGLVRFVGPASDEDISASGGTTRRRTPEEQGLIEDLTRLKGRPLAKQEANFAIEQARAFGDL